jgi:phytoene dehydrogenase-like protein
MGIAEQPGSTPTSDEVEVLDALIIGGGVSGIYQLYGLRKIGVNARIFEAGGGVGGTWYWNRYPGARFDSESYSYAYSFSDDLLREWNWTEHYSAQPENERYLNFVVDKFDLRKHMQFNCRVVSMHFDETTDTWRITLTQVACFMTHPLQSGPSIAKTSLNSFPLPSSNISILRRQSMAFPSFLDASRAGARVQRRPGSAACTSPPLPAGSSLSGSPPTPSTIP